MRRYTASLLRRWRDHLAPWPIEKELLAQTYVQQSQHDFLIRAEWARLLRDSKNPLNRFGAKYFSQADEDGITLEIIKRIGIKDGVFAELGVGNGLQNNTIILLANGWRGFWIGGEDIAFDHTLNPRRFAFLKDWVTLDNLTSLMKRGLASIKAAEIELLSIDLDGNDFYFLRKLLEEGILPKLLIVEYNGKFPPPIKWTISYDPSHKWDDSDYQGASLALFSELLAGFSYNLICCNAATGANAFFIRSEYMSEFTEIPKSIDDIFVGCRYQVPRELGHYTSPKTIERMLQMGSPS